MNLFLQKQYTLWLFCSLRSQNSSQGLAKLHAFALQPSTRATCLRADTHRQKHAEILKPIGGNCIQPEKIPAKLTLF
ncbi:MAG TPA: hypothetical protein VI957_02640 [Candidatus Paceibacterota bacterium]